MAGKRSMRLIVGLGNPDPEYQWTPHNLGFMAVDELANRSGIRVERPEGKALVGRGKVAGEEVILAKPQTYMNLSGISVRDLLEKYELGPEDLLVMFDERDLPWGMIRIGERGSPGTHNGAKSVTSVVGTQEFARLRLGCPPDNAGRRKQAGPNHHRTCRRRKGRQDREDRALGHAQAGLQGCQAPRRHLRLPAGAHQPRRAGSRTRAASWRARLDHQVPDR